MQSFKYVNYHKRISSNFFSKILFSYLFIITIFLSLLFTAVSINNFFFTDEATIVKQFNNSISDEDGQNINSVIKIKTGDNLYKILQSQNLDAKDIANIVEASRSVSLHKYLKAGEKIYLNYDISIRDTEDDLTTEAYDLKQLTYNLSDSKKIEITRLENGNFEAKLLTVPLKKVLSKHKAVISHSFLNAAKSMNISTKSIIKLINAFSHQIDFQRDIKEGDTLEVITEKFYNEQGKISSYGDVIFASLNLSGKIYNIYLYKHANNQPQYFSEEAESVKKNLLRTPVKIIRISSHYGHRKHPILGFTKMHQGVDFAAPVGTPIYAAGDGIVVQMGHKGGYGNYIKIKHNGTISTAYGHVSKFAKNIKNGSRVKQNQVIAYVGSTGSATGPHLHYEVLVNNKHINPISVKTMPGIKLTGSEMKKFNKFKGDIKALVTTLSNNKEVATTNINSKISG